MWQTVVKVVQVAIFCAVIVWVYNDPAMPKERNGYAIWLFAVIVVMIVTVIPWLIFKMIEQGVSDFRRLRTRRSSGRLPIKSKGQKWLR
jgi:uncharacterized sodium:solute symporter family permease YidK